MRPPIKRGNAAIVFAETNSRSLACRSDKNGKPRKNLTPDEARDLESSNPGSVFAPLTMEDITPAALEELHGGLDAELAAVAARALGRVDFLETPGLTDEQRERVRMLSQRAAMSCVLHLINESDGA